MLVSTLCLRNKGSLATLVLFAVLPLIAQKSSAESNVAKSLDYQIGEAIFDKIWVFAPASTKSSDGLGPFYNARSCQQCHAPSRKDKNDLPASLVLQISVEEAVNLHKHPSDMKKSAEHYKIGFMPDPVYGKEIQTFAYPGAMAEATIQQTTEKKRFDYPDGHYLFLSVPQYRIHAPAYGPLHPNLKVSPRTAPRIHSLGLIDAISIDDIEANADPEDKNNDGISGRVSRVWDLIKQKETIGKFGWKASKPTLEQQNLAALNTDIGISSWLFSSPSGDCTERQIACKELALKTETHLSNNEPYEASKEMTDLLTLFTAKLNDSQNPYEHSMSPNLIIKGAEHFKKAGCDGCHLNFIQPNLSETHDEPASVTIALYSDLLLHDMGEDLSDNRQEFNANGNEWRTAPLWGIAQYLSQSPNPKFLHDGRATNVEEAILWHAGEAETSKISFTRLTKQQRTELIQFVESL